MQEHPIATLEAASRHVTHSAFEGYDLEPEITWLRRMGVVDIDEYGNWQLTDLGERAMERYWHTSAEAACPHPCRSGAADLKC